MATQGLVSVVHRGEVKIKIIAGCNGYKAKYLASQIRKMGRIPTLDEAFKLAQACEFGSPENLVVLDSKHSKKTGRGRLKGRYRETFRNPHFNPRWDRGTADHVFVVRFKPYF